MRIRTYLQDKYGLLDASARQDYTFWWDWTSTPDPYQYVSYYRNLLNEADIPYVVIEARSNYSIAIEEVIKHMRGEANHMEDALSKLTPEQLENIAESVRLTLEMEEQRQQEKDHFMRYGIGGMHPIAQELFGGLGNFIVYGGNEMSYGIVDKLTGGTISEDEEWRRKTAGSWAIDAGKTGGMLMGGFAFAKLLKNGLSVLNAAGEQLLINIGISSPRSAALIVEGFAGEAVFSTVNEAVDAILDTRNDGEQSFLQRTQQVAVDSALGGMVGGALGLTTDAVKVGYTAFKTNASKKLFTPLGELNLVINKGMGNAWKNPDLLDELANSGVKYCPENVLAVTKTADGKLVWLETGNPKAGMQHILDHADDFAYKGIQLNQIQDLVMESLTNGKVVGYQGRGTGRPIYEVTFEGNTYHTAITVGDNGFIVGANPTTWP